MTVKLAAIPLQSFDQIRSQWVDLLPHCPVNTFFLLPQWQEVWWEAFQDGREFAGFYLERPEGVTAIASLARQGDSLSFVGNTETFDYNDFMIRRGGEDDFFLALMEWLEQDACHSLELPSLIEDSPTLERLPDLARRHGYSVEVTEEDVTPGLELPEDWESYLAGLSKKNRHELRRKLRRLEAVEGWRWYRVHEPEEVQQRLDDFLALMRRSDPEKAAYMTGEREVFFRHIARRTAEMGLLTIFFLEMDGQDVAASLCFDYNDARYLYNSGYNPDYGYYSVGLLLNALCLRDAIDGGMTYFDFLRGPEPYKYHLGGLNRTIYRMVVSKPETAAHP